jgi:3-oxoadipate enol-lactonase
VPALAERFRLLRVDTRGHGGSPVPPGPYGLDELGGDLIALLNRVGIGRASLCGLSLGGMVAMWMAAEAPERVDRIVLCSTTARFPDEAGEVYGQRAETVRAQGTGAVAEAVLERWLTPPFREANPAVAERLRAMITMTPPEGYAGCCEAIRDMNLEPALGSIAAPTLVIAASGDPATPPDHAQRIADAVAGARLELVQDAAHLANIEQPEAVTSAILGHLET